MLEGNMTHRRFWIVHAVDHMHHEAVCLYDPLPDIFIVRSEGREALESALLGGGGRTVHYLCEGAHQVVGYRC